MLEVLTGLFDSSLFLKIEVIFGCILLVGIIVFYFSNEGRDERGRGIVAASALIAFVILFVVLNILPLFMEFLMDNTVRMANGIQFLYNIVLLSADISVLIMRKVR